MATTSTKQFVRSVERLKKLPAATAKSAVKLHASTAVVNAEQAVKQATGGSSRLRNAGANVKAGTRVVGKRGASLTVGTVPALGEEGVVVRAIGPWQLIEYPTEQHFIGPAGLAKTAVGAKSGRGQKARLGRAKALRTPYGVKRWVYVKGTRGKYPWHKALEKTKAQAPEALKQASRIEVAKTIR